MMTFNSMKRATLGTALAAALAAGMAATIPVRASAQPAGVAAPANDISLSIGTGRLVRLNGTMSDLFVANDAIADVQVRSPTQVYIFGRAPGSTTVYATDRAGRVIYSANVRVGQNLGSVDELLDLAMPEAEIQATPLSGMVLLTGTSPSLPTRPRPSASSSRSSAKARRWSAACARDTAAGDAAGDDRRGQPLADPSDGFQPSGRRQRLHLRQRPHVLNSTGQILRPSRARHRGGPANVFGLDVAGAVDLNENNGLVTILAEPTLTALSGETASFLAGGEFPIPVSQSLGAVTIEYKQFGVGLAFSPIVLENGRISMRVRPEVSELSSEGSITLNGSKCLDGHPRRDDGESLGQSWD